MLRLQILYGLRILHLHLEITVQATKDIIMSVVSV